MRTRLNEQNDFVRTAAMALAAAICFPGTVRAQWVSFRLETADRLIAPDELGISDITQKSYAWGDVDNDGDIDLVCARKDAGASRIGRRNVLFLNQGIPDGHLIDGVLVDSTERYATLADDGQGFLDSTNDRDVLLVDLNEDGWLDIVTATTLGEGRPRSVSHPRIYMNQGLILNIWEGFSLEFERFPALAVVPGGNFGTPRFSSVAAGDLDQDGALDLYFASDDTGMTPPPSSDVNDRLLINDGHEFFLDSEQEWAPAEILFSDVSMSAVLLDINGDFRPDLIKSERFGALPQVRASLNRPTLGGAPYFHGWINLGGQLPTELASGDLNNDGFADLIITDDGYDSFLLQRRAGSDGTPHFRSRLFFPADFSDAGMAGNAVVADLDGDGFNDVIITDADANTRDCTRRTRFFRNLGNGANVQLQEDPLVMPTAVGVHDVAVFDLNADGLLDLVLGKCTGNEVWIQEPAASTDFSYPDGRPALLPPGQPFDMRVVIADQKGENPVAAALHVGIDGAPPTAHALTSLGGALFRGTFPPLPCGASVQWFASADFRLTGTFNDPPDHEARAYRAFVSAEPEVLLLEDFETADQSWTVHSENLSAGAWQRADPIEAISGTSITTPDDDTSRNPGRFAFVTGVGTAGGSAFSHDVDGGPTYLLSPPIDLTDSDAVVTFSYWVFCSTRFSPEEDKLAVEVSRNGVEWVRPLLLPHTGSKWATASFRVGAFLNANGPIQLRFAIDDEDNQSITEALVDDFRVLRLPCSPRPPAIGGSEPPGGSIDARQPSDPASTIPQGWSNLILMFDPDANGVTLPSLTTFDASPAPPMPVQLVPVAADTVDLRLSRSLTPGAWLEITHGPSDSAVRIGFLPGDVDQNARTEATDVVALIAVLSADGLRQEPWTVDIDRTGELSLLDLVRLVDVLMGAGEIAPWLGRTLP